MMTPSPAPDGQAGGCLSSAPATPKSLQSSASSSLAAASAVVPVSAAESYSVGKSLAAQGHAKSRGGLTGGCAGSAGASFDCTKCGRTLPLSSQSSRKGVCVPDSAAYKALADKWSKQRQLRTWWMNLSPEEQRAWYLKQQDVPSGTKRKFQDMMHAETTQEIAGNVEDEIDNFITWTKFKRDGLLEGTSVPDLEDQWKQLVDDPNVETIKRRGQWLVPEFVGVQRRKRHGLLQSSASTRAASVSDPEHLQRLRQTGRENIKAFLEAVPDTRSIPVLDCPFVETTEAEQPVRQPPVDVVAAAINRDVTAQYRAEAVRAAYDADDLMAASLISKDIGAEKDTASKGKSLSLEVIKAQGKIMEAKTKFGNARAELDSEFQSVVSMCKALGAAGSEKDETLEKVERELAAMHVAMQQEVNGKVQSLTQSDDRLKACRAVQEVSDIRNQVSDSLKALTKGTSIRSGTS